MHDLLPTGFEYSEKELSTKLSKIHGHNKTDDDGVYLPLARPPNWSLFSVHCFSIDSLVDSM